MVYQQLSGMRALGCFSVNSPRRFRVIICTVVSISQIEISVKLGCGGFAQHRATRHATTLCHKESDPYLRKNEVASLAMTPNILYDPEI